jgi:hypothetical protein
MKALLEKIDSPDFLDSGGVASSHPYISNSPEYRVNSLLQAGGLNRYEIVLVKRALARAQRTKALNKAMEIVLNMPSERESLTASERGLMTETTYSPYAQAIFRGEGQAIPLAALQRNADPFSIYKDDQLRNQAIDQLKSSAKRINVVKK